MTIPTVKHSTPATVETFHATVVLPSSSSIAPARIVHNELLVSVAPNEAKATWTTDISTFAAAGGFLVSAILAIVALKQIKLAKRQAMAAETSAEAARKTAAHMELIDVPIFVIESALAVSANKFEIKLGNHGRTGARIEGYAVGSKIVAGLGSINDFDKLPFQKESQERIVGPGHVYTVSINLDSEWFDDDGSKVGKFLCLYGYLAYRDFREERMTRYFGIGFSFEPRAKEEESNFYNPEKMARTDGPDHENVTVQTQPKGRY